MTTRARDFKFAGAIVQRLYLVMVALTKNRLSAQYGWFCHGRSHILCSIIQRRTIIILLLCMTIFVIFCIYRGRRTKQYSLDLWRVGIRDPFTDFDCAGLEFTPINAVKLYRIDLRNS